MSCNIIGADCCRVCGNPTAQGREGGLERRGVVSVVPTEILKQTSEGDMCSILADSLRVIVGPREDCSSSPVNMVLPRHKMRMYNQTQYHHAEVAYGVALAQDARPQCDLSA